MREISREHLAVRLSDQRLRYAAAALAYVVAGLHLFHPDFGFAQLVVRLSMGPELLAADPRPAAFSLSGFALLAGVVAVLAGVPGKPVYALGIALMGTYVAGYFAWHVAGHGGFLPGRKPLRHGLDAHEAVIAHMTDDPWAASAVIAEVTLLVVLAVLYDRER